MLDLVISSTYQWQSKHVQNQRRYDARVDNILNLASKWTHPSRSFSEETYRLVTFRYLWWLRLTQIPIRTIPRTPSCVHISSWLHFGYDKCHRSCRCYYISILVYMIVKPEIQSSGLYYFVSYLFAHVPDVKFVFECDKLSLYHMANNIF